MPSSNRLCFGEERPPRRLTELRAGPLTLSFDEGDIRYVRLGEREIVRRLYFAVRDDNWGTPPPTLSELQVHACEDHFEISFRAHHREGAIDFAWLGTIRGDVGGTVTFTVEGQANAEFLSNRIGLCLLHPVRECAGRACEVEHTDGSREVGRFPLHISPHQPFFDIRAIAHEVGPGLWAEVRLEGEVFEMEDQRNWSDASYKTYSRPLALPKPFAVPAGSVVRQSATINLRVEGTGGREQAPYSLSSPLSPVPSALPLAASVGAAPLGSLPLLGVQVASGGERLGAREVERLRALSLAHLRVELQPAEAGWQARLEQATAEARSLGVPLEVAAVLGEAPDAELPALRRAVDSICPLVASWLVYHTAEGCTGTAWMELARHHLSGYDPAARFGGGSNVHFTELNRGRPPLELLDLVAFGMNPQVHAFDDLSIVETLEGQAWNVASARRLARGLPLAVTPVTLRSRQTGGPEAGLPPGADARQSSLFAAAWTVGSLQRLAEGGVYSATYYETAGPLGLMEQEGVFPTYLVFADLGEVAGGIVYPVVVSDPLKLAGLAVSSGGRLRLLLANLTSKRQPVTVHGLPLSASLRFLDEGNSQQAMLAPEEYRARPPVTAGASGGALSLELLPYAIATLDTY